jgi:hypothetical protein
MAATTTFAIARTGLAIPSAALDYSGDSSPTVLMCPASSHGCQLAAPVVVHVTVGLIGDTLTQITSGLSAGDTVVLSSPPPAAAATTRPGVFSPCH